MTMRDAIIIRINDISFQEQGFKLNISRWHKTVLFKPSYAKQDMHLSKIDFERLTDEEMVEFFELIMSRYYRQM